MKAGTTQRLPRVPPERGLLLATPGEPNVAASERVISVRIVEGTSSFPVFMIQENESTCCCLHGFIQLAA